MKRMRERQRYSRNRCIDWLCSDYVESRSIGIENSIIFRKLRAFGGSKTV